jgi:trk system potassium uptake protein TrkA
MKIVVLGAGNVGTALVHALHQEHDVTVIDTDGGRLLALAQRFDVRTVEGNGTTRPVLGEAGIADAALFVAVSSRQEANLVSAMLVRKASSARVIVRTTSPEYLEAWHERELDVDFMISTELETANAISQIIGLPAARQTDVFADGKVQIVEFDVPHEARRDGVVGRPLRSADLPGESKVVAVIREAQMLPPRGEEQLRPGDRVIVIASPASARRWSDLLGRGDDGIGDIVIFGAGQMGGTIARVLLERGIRVRLCDEQRERTLSAAERLPGARVFHASAFDPEFLERERIGRAAAAVFCMNDDARNLYGGVLAKVHGLRLTIALVHDPVSTGVYERGGIDVAINPRQVTAEEIVRFAHDPRIRQIAMLEDDRFEVLDLTVRSDSELAGRRFRDLPRTGSIIGAVIRDGSPIFPRSDDVLLAGDRVIVFVESRRASIVEKVL